MNCRSAHLSLSCHSLLNAEETALGSRVSPFAPRRPTCHGGPCGLPLWSVPQGLRPNASHTVDPKAHPDLHVCKSGLSHVSDTCSLAVNLLFTFCSGSLLVEMAIHLKSVFLSPSQKVHAQERGKKLCGAWEAGRSPHRRARSLSLCLQQQIS